MDLDTQALVNYERKGVRLFHRPIEDIQVPLLITVSRADQMLANDMEGECRRLCGLNPDIRYKLYETGEHPVPGGGTGPGCPGVSGFGRGNIDRPRSLGVFPKS